MSKSKAKGTALETACVDYAKEHGHPQVKRLVMKGAKDEGDLDFGRNCVVEVKNRKAMALGPWMNEAKKEAENAGVTRYALIHKRRGVGDIGEQFCTMPYWLFLELLND